MAGATKHGFWVARGDDRSGAHYGVGIGTLAFKVSTEDSDGTLLAVEVAHHAPGGPARHMHHNQDEWFYIVEGEYIVEIGGERFHLSPGDSAFGPRGVPHVWAHVGDGPGRIAFAIAPAGRLEAFFREIARSDAMAPQDPAFWPPYDMELAGPPLALE